jgi:bifunctional non-homologous end joining protein LigD
MAEPREEHIYLHSTKDGADKDYNLHLVPDAAGDGLWHLDYENGKHGAALKRKPKIEGAVPYEVAKKEFDTTVYEKMKKGGYLPQGAGTAYQDVLPTERRSGIEPQLLEAISVEAAMQRLADPDFIWQEKKDGERRPVRKTTDENGVVVVVGTNREGLIVSIPKQLEEAVAALPVPFCVIDGEDLGQGRLAVFDLIRCPDDPDGRRPYDIRLNALEELLQAAPSACWVPVPTARTPGEAQLLLEVVRLANGEGLVGKRRSAPYSPGTNSHDQFKWPFLDRVTCYVERLDGTKRSVHIAVLGPEGAAVPMKKVTIPANYEMPPVGAVVDVEYLYAYPGGGLAQPRYKGIRGDRRLEHCVHTQLKFKASADVAPEGQQHGYAEDEDENDAMTMTPGC